MCLGVWIQVFVRCWWVWVGVSVRVTGSLLREEVGVGVLAAFRMEDHTLFHPLTLCI